MITKNISDISREDAEIKFNEYTELLKTKNEKWIKQLQTAYKYLKDGKQIIDIYEVFRNNKLKNGLPTLALARADMDRIVYQKKRNGAGAFGLKTTNPWGSYKLTTILKLPKGTMKTMTSEYGFYDTHVPIIPAEFVPTNDFSKYFILFEVEKWDSIAPPKSDPILLARISENLFVVLAVWELTELERRLIRK